MCGATVVTEGMFSYLSSHQRVSKDRPIFATRVTACRNLDALSQHFVCFYLDHGRPFTSREHLYWALLLKVFFSIRPVRQFI